MDTNFPKIPDKNNILSEEIRIGLSEVAELFTVAEEKLKLIEHLGEGLSLPPVNQLRYVGFHLLRAFKSLNNGESQEEPIHTSEELRKAKNHAQRAIYDASEIGIIHCLEQIAAFQNDYRKVEITSVISDYLNICKRADEANEFIAQMTRRSIADHCNNRGDKYSNSIKHYKALYEDIIVLRTARTELNKKMENNRQQLFFSMLGIIIALMGLIVVIIFS